MDPVSAPEHDRDDGLEGLSIHELLQRLEGRLAFERYVAREAQHPEAVVDHIPFERTNAVIHALGRMARPDPFDPDVTPRPRAELRVAPSVAAAVFHLPASARIVGARWADDRMRLAGQLVLTLEGEAFPYVAPGDPLPELDVLTRRDETGRVTLESMTLRPCTPDEKART